MLHVCVWCTYLWSWTSILKHACMYGACIYDASNFVTNQRTDKQGDSRSRMCIHVYTCPKPAFLSLSFSLSFSWTGKMQEEPVSGRDWNGRPVPSPWFIATLFPLQTRLHSICCSREKWIESANENMSLIHNPLMQLFIIWEFSRNQRRTWCIQNKTF